MTIELPERHPSPPLHPCTEPNSEPFEKLRRTRLRLMNLVREALLARFPNAVVNADEQRRLRAALYRPLLALQKDERSRVVDVVVATLPAE